MSEREPIKIRVRPDELAPESIPAVPTGEILPVTPVQADRLTGFSHLLRQVFTAEQEERRDGRPNHYGRLDASGKLVESYIRLDARFRAILNERAQRRYEQEFLPDPAMKLAADGIIASLKSEFDGPPAMSSTELRTLYDRSPRFEADAENGWGSEGRGTIFDYEGSEGGRE